MTQPDSDQSNPPPDQPPPNPYFEMRDVTEHNALGLHIQFQTVVEDAIKKCVDYDNQNRPHLKREPQDSLEQLNQVVMAYKTFSLADEARRNSLKVPAPTVQLTRPPSVPRRDGP